MCEHGYNRKPSAVTWMPFGPSMLPLALVLMNQLFYNVALIICPHN